MVFEASGVDEAADGVVREVAQSPGRCRVGVGCVVFLGLGSFSSRESIGWIPCQQRDTQTSSRPK